MEQRLKHINGIGADIYRFQSHFFSQMVTRIINEAKGINRVVYDYSHKLSGKIEWE